MRQRPTASEVLTFFLLRLSSHSLTSIISPFSLPTFLIFPITLPPSHPPQVLGGPSQVQQSSRPRASQGRECITGGSVSGRRRRQRGRR